MAHGLLIVIGLFIIVGLWAKPLVRLMQRRLPDMAIEGDQLLLWGGLLLSAVGLGLLMLYLFLQP